MGLMDGINKLMSRNAVKRIGDVSHPPPPSDLMLKKSKMDALQLQHAQRQAAKQQSLAQMYGGQNQMGGAATGPFGNGYNNPLNSGGELMGLVENLIGGEFMLEPIPVVGTDNWRVPVRMSEYLMPIGSRHYDVWVGKRMRRAFDDVTLPDCIKSKLALIHNSKEAMSDPLPIVQPEHHRIQIELFISKYPAQYDDVGWRVTGDFFCIVLHRDDLISLQGETVVSEESADEQSHA